MKYYLNKELSKMGRKKAPSKIFLYPVVNIFLQMYTCKSDDDVFVKKCYIPGYGGANLKTFPPVRLDFSE